MTKERKTMKKATRFVVILLAVLLALGAAALAAEGAVGTEEDPLVTLSYLDEVFTANDVADYISF